MLVVQASSAGFYGGKMAEITINDVLVEVEKNENNHYRGLHIVIINRFNGEVESAKVFDTYKASNSLDNFIDQGIPDNSIVVAACNDECVTNLSLAVKKWFESMGSSEIGKLEYRQGFVFIGMTI